MGSLAQARARDSERKMDRRVYLARIAGEAVSPDDGGALQETQGTGASDRLRVVLHAKLPADIENVLLDGADTHDERRSDGGVAGAIGQQLQYLKLALGERIEQWRHCRRRGWRSRTGLRLGLGYRRAPALRARGGEEKIRIGQLAIRHSEPSLLRGIEQVGKQRRHGCPLVGEEADIALWPGQRQRLQERAHCAARVATSVERQRPQDEDLNYAVPAPLGFGVRQQPLQEPQRLGKVGAGRLPGTEA